MKVISYIDGKLTLENGEQRCVLGLDQYGMSIEGNANVCGNGERWILTMKVYGNVLTFSDVDENGRPVIR